MLARITDISDENLILPVLEADRRGAVYALCDLDPPYRRHARFVGAIRDGRADAIVLLYRLPTGIAIAPFGDARSVRNILTGMTDPPPSVLLMVGDPYMPALRERYTIDDAWQMDRMAVEARDLRPAAPVQVPLVRLTPDHLPALMSLYGIAVDAYFLGSMLADGIFYGATDGVRLIAVAGTHTLSRRHRIATIGGVYTHPDYRGRGLATATTGAVTQAVVQEGIELIALNVRRDNASAIAAYRRLGFIAHAPFWEGHATLR